MRLAPLGALLLAFACGTALADGALPAQVIVVPGDLSARVLHHAVTTPAGTFPCWTYASTGLAAHGQKELVLTLLRRPAEAPEQFPREPLAFFEKVLELARAGRLVDEGALSELGPTGFLGRTDLRALFYVRAVDFGDFRASGPALAVVGLVGDELRFLKEQGPLRVMGRLAAHYRFYPCPPWIDRDRAPIVTAAEMGSSLLTRLPRIHVRGLRVVLSGNQVTLRLRQSARADVLEALSRAPSEKSVLAFLGELDPVANALAVWRPGQSELEAVGPPGSDGSRLAGTFVAMGGGVAEGMVRSLEDGFVVLLAAEEWKSLRAALDTGNPVTLAGIPGGRRAFAVEFIPDSYRSPADGKSYRGDFETFAPRKAAPASTGPVAVDHLVLLTSEAEMRAAGVQVPILAAYIQDIEKAVERYFASKPEQPGRDMVVQCELQGGKSVVLVGARPREGAPDLTELRESLGRTAAPPYAVKLEIHFKLWGGARAR